MKSLKIPPKKSKAQAMVEFAIVLPILLLLLYGLLEAGRLLFIYSTIVTASRQAVRYGSATGLGVGVAVPRYQDCAGIRAAANRVDFLDSFDHTSSAVLIQWDNGPTDPNPPTTICAPGVATDPSYSPTNNNTRLLVTIDGDYLPIVPKIVPFLERSTAGGDPIESESARTVLVSVAIQVTIPPSTFNPNTPTATNTKTPTPTPTPTNTPTFTPSPTPVYTDTPSQTPTATFTPTITSTPTPTFTPTSAYSPVPSCTGLAPGLITLPDRQTAPSNTMSMTITNPFTYPIAIGNIFLVWNNDSGHQTGGDKTLILTSASIAGVTFWTPTPPSTGIDSPSTSIAPNPGVTAFIPPGTSTLTFFFHQTYDNQDNSEEILINLSSNGCQLNPIHQKVQP